MTSKKTAKKKKKSATPAASKKKWRPAAAVPAISDAALAAREAAEDINLDKVFGRGLCYKVTTGALGVKVAVKEGKKVADALNVEDDRMIRVSKRILDAKEYDDVMRVGRVFRKELRRVALSAPGFEKGVYFVPLEMFDRVEKAREQALADHAAAVGLFCEEYKSIKATAQKSLGKQFNPDDYPPVEEVRRAFYIRTQVRKYTVDEKLKTIDAHLFKQQVEQWNETLAEVAGEFRIRQREVLQELVRHLHRRLLGKDDDGDPRVFRDSAIKNLDEFVGLFQTKDVTNDVELGKVVAHVKKLIHGVDADALRSDDELRQSVGQAMQQVHTALGDLMQGKPVRALRMPQRHTA